MSSKRATQSKRARTAGGTFGRPALLLHYLSERYPPQAARSEACSQSHTDLGRARPFRQPRP